ncbi:hypothetical protein ABPG72_008622 [Tetrahymena utriculariae]
MEKIYDSFLDKSVTKENYYELLQQIVSKSYRNNRWAEYQIEKYAKTLMKLDGYDDQILIESETDFYLLLRALLDKREQINYYPSLIFNTQEESIQKFRIYQFLDVSKIQTADLSKEILKIQSELSSLNSLKAHDISQLYKLNSQIINNLQSLSLIMKCMSVDKVAQLNYILKNSNLRSFSVQLEFIEESEELEEHYLKKSTKFLISKYLHQLSFSSNCYDYFNEEDLLNCQFLEIYIFDYEIIDKIKFLNFKNINKMHFNIQFSSNQNKYQEIIQIIIQNQLTLAEITLSLFQLFKIAENFANLVFPILQNLNIIESEQYLDEQSLYLFLSNQINLKFINIEMTSSSINQNIFAVISKLYLKKNQKFDCKCYQSNKNMYNQHKYINKNLFHFLPQSVEFINEFQGYNYDSVFQLSYIILSLQEASNLIKINLNLNSRICTLSDQDQENVIFFICKNKLAESVKVNFSLQVQNKKIYSILVDNIGQLTNLKEGSFGFNFQQQFDSYDEFKRVMEQCITLDNLVSLCWILNGHGEDFEIFAIESLIDYHKITDLQIENHVKGAYCIEIFMDYINQFEKQYKLWQKIKNVPLEQINYFFMKKRMPKLICFELAYLISSNQYIQSFTTSTYDIKILREETIDYYFYIFFSNRISITLFYKTLFKYMQLNPLYVIYDLYI